MPEEIEVETKELQETIDELREEREEREREARETHWTRFISLSTAIFAVVAAVAALQAGKLVNEAVLLKNDAVLQQARASDTWAYYQAKGIKSAMAKQTADLISVTPGAAEKAAHWKEEAERQKAEQAQLKGEAEELEKKRDERDHESNGLLEHHELFAQCVTCLQVAISLSAIAALTKRKDVWLASIVLGVFGTGLFITGFVKHPATMPHADAMVAAESAPPNGKAIGIPGALKPSAGGGASHPPADGESGSPSSASAHGK
jgi:Domain of unknown function (DUF4337)